MGQSLVKSFYHIIFSTKARQPFINTTIEGRLYNYLAGICSELECHLNIIGGHIDHVHILYELSKKVTIVKLLESLKSSSSKWMKLQDSSLSTLYWQNGYGAFSVNPKEVDVVRKYIEDQHAHHSRKTFQEEYRAFLVGYAIAFDERYVWD
jgi:REP element-mobilizing transposase RayT